MKNTMQLYLSLFATFMVGQSLAADMNPLEVRNAHVVRNLSPGLGKRQFVTTTYCPVGTFQCPGDNGCCGLGTQCLPNAKCSGGCGAGSTKCYDGCCEAGYMCKGPNQPCEKTTVDITTNTNTISLPDTPVSKTSVVSIPGATISKASTSSTTLTGYYTTTPTVPKPTTSSTTVVNPYPTYTPTPPTTVGGNYSTNTTTGKPGSSSLAVVPLNGGNSLQPAGWLGGFGMVLFFAFFNM